MRILIRLFVFGAALSATLPASAACVSVDGTKSRINNQTNGTQVMYEILTADEVTALSQRYKAAYKNTGDAFEKADSALVFHKPDAGNLAWLVLFKDGCAVAEGPIEETVLNKPSQGADAPQAK